VARLFRGEKSQKEGQVRRLLRRCNFGLREVEIAQELGWDRRTVNNYLRALKGRGRVYKEGRSWFVED
jgi:DNA-binding NarL/FixJ family response regulator